ncbi:MAG TPA: ABC transporter transmembrane domain-containing protein, partial [Solimonas sp.]
MSRRLAAETPDDPAPSTDWRVLRTLWPYLTEFPVRVAVAMAFLVLAKLAGVALPMFLKHLVDSLDIKDGGLFLLPLGLLLAYGAMRFAAALFGELRDLVFGRVSERAMRRAALKVFQHLHRLDLDFHLTRRTGGLSRDIERGVSGISFLLRFTLFNIIPTLLEIGLVAAILLFNYGASFALITGISVALYVFFSVVVTEWRTQYVREANALDSRANTRAVDSLLNYETVKLFGNEKHEADEYDRFLAKWETAQQQQRLSLGALNAGQALIVAVALTWMMVLAAQQVGAGTMTLGDFVAVNAYIIQLFVPLNFLGFVYREIRRAMTDMQRMFGLLQQRPKVADAPDAPDLVLAPAEAGLSFEKVSFGYSDKR